MSIHIYSSTVNVAVAGVTLALQDVNVLLRLQYVTVNGVTCHKTVSSENTSPGALQLL